MEKQIVGKVIAHLMPILILLFVVNYLDRTNIAMAKLKMLTDTGISESIYGLGAGLFFIGYFIFEVPSNLIMERIGARIWMTRIMITWGLICASMMFVVGPWSFYVLRFLLGVAEAGFFPGIVLYLTYWIPQKHRSIVLAWFLTSTAVSGIIGNPLAGLLMKLDGVYQLHGWQWLFLIEGIAPVLLGFVTIYYLPDKPHQVKWLTEEEKEYLETSLAHETQSAGSHVRELQHALADARLWMLSLLYFLLIMGLYGYIYWLPSIIKSVSTDSSVLMIGFLAAIPCAVAAVTMVIIGKHADVHNDRRRHIAVCALLAAGGVATITASQSLYPTLLILCVAAVGIWGSLGPFWSLSTRFLKGRAAAGGIAIVNSIGALAGFVAPPLIGWVKQSTGGFKGLFFVSISLVLGAGLAMLIPKKIDQSNL